VYPEKEQPWIIYTVFPTEGTWDTVSTLKKFMVLKNQDNVCFFHAVNVQFQRKKVIQSMSTHDIRRRGSPRFKKFCALSSFSGRNLGIQLQCLEPLMHEPNNNNNNNNNEIYIALNPNSKRFTWLNPLPKRQPWKDASSGETWRRGG
jgi:hypothetical protein